MREPPTQSAPRSRHQRPLLALFLLLSLAASSRAQWITQSFDLVPGWNAIYTHVDATHASLDSLLAPSTTNPIQEVWLWKPAAATAQFITSPQLPTTTGSQWITWERAVGAASALQSFPGNTAFLVKVGGNTNYTWRVKGRAVPPNYLWTSSGLNFIGFPTPIGASPTFDRFLGPSPTFYQAAEIYAYLGGELSSTNPARVFATRTKIVRRGEAYWIRSGNTFNSYFGPFELSLDDSTGINFGGDLGQSRLRLRNLTAAPITVTLRLLNSETPPVGQPAIVQVPPLLVRGTLNTTNLTYGYSNLGTASQNVVLAASGQIGSQAEVVIGLNRFQMSGAPGSLYAGILRLTDAAGLSQVDVPVSAAVSSRAGLWVGDAAVSSVNQYLKSYQTNQDGSMQTTADGAYVAGQTNTDAGAVPRSYPLRLIIHNDGTNSYLLQRAFQGFDANSNLVVTTQEHFLNPATLNSARRVSCVHLPWSAANNGWLFTNPLGAASSIAVTVPIVYDDQSSNPFLHTYHPDHSGMDSTGHNPLQRGQHSYDITRVMILTFTAPETDFASLAANSASLKGTYSENVTFRGIGNNSRQFQSNGQFTLQRISDVQTLTR